MSRRLRRTLIAGLVTGVAGLALIRGFAGRVYRVASPSMAPTLLTGDWVIGERLHAPGSMERGAVVAFQKRGEAEASVKRIIGLPGDVVTMESGVVSVNGLALAAGSGQPVSFDGSGEEIHRNISFPERELFEERDHDHHWTTALMRIPGDIPRDGRWTVPAGSVFVMGDNRDASIDSRDALVGFVPIDAIVARIVRVVASSGPGGFRSRWWVAVP